MSQVPHRTDPEPLSGAAALPPPSEQRPDDDCVRLWANVVGTIPGPYGVWARQMAAELQAERARLEELEDWISKVYLELTGGKLSKPWYRPAVIIGEVEDACTRDTMAELERAKAEWGKTFRALWDSRRHWQRLALADFDKRTTR